MRIELRSLRSLRSGMLAVTDPDMQATHGRLCTGRDPEPALRAGSRSLTVPLIAGGARLKDGVLDELKTSVFTNDTFDVTRVDETPVALRFTGDLPEHVSRTVCVRVCVRAPLHPCATP